MTGDLIPITDEQAKSIQELAKATGASVELAGKAGTYIAAVLGTVPHDLVGVLGGDWLAQARIRNLARLKDRTEEILRSRGVTETIPVSPSLAVPMLRAAADEGQDKKELQEWWARLIAAAMDPSRSSRVRKEYVTIVAQLNPLDAILLESLYTTPGDLQPNPRDFMAGRLGVSSREIEVSAQYLDSLKVVRMGDASKFLLTSYGSELVRACST